MRGTASGQDMLCLDLLTVGPSASQPHSIGAPGGNSIVGYTRLHAVGTDIYFETGSVPGCFDTVTQALCTAFNAGSSLDTSATAPMFSTTDATGAVTQVCAYNATARWDLAGASGTWPVNLPANISSSAPDGRGADLNLADAGTSRALTAYARGEPYWGRMPGPTTSRPPSAVIVVPVM